MEGLSMTEKKVTIQVDVYGRGKVIVGEHDISAFVESVDFACKAGDKPEVRLKLSPRYPVEIKAETNRVIWIDDAV
jgi:hypothetical protein